MYAVIRQSVQHHHEQQIAVAAVCATVAELHWSCHSGLIVFIAACMSPVVGQLILNLNQIRLRKCAHQLPTSNGSMGGGC